MGIKVKPKDVLYTVAYNSSSIGEEHESIGDLRLVVIQAKGYLEEDGEEEIGLYRVEKIGTIKCKVPQITEPPAEYTFVMPNGTIHGHEEEFVKALEK